MEALEEVYDSLGGLQNVAALRINYCGQVTLDDLSHGHVDSKKIKLAASLLFLHEYLNPLSGGGVETSEQALLWQELKAYYEKENVGPLADNSTTTGIVLEVYSTDVVSGESVSSFSPGHRNRVRAQKPQSLDDVFKESFFEDLPEHQCYEAIPEDFGGVHLVFQNHRVFSFFHG